MKKILHIQVLPKLTGVQRISLEILKGLPHDEYDKYILFSNNGVDNTLKLICREAFEKSGIKVLFCHTLYREIGIRDIQAFIEIYKLCKQEKFDIVHTHSTKPGIIGRIAATLAHVPYVIHTVHGLAFHSFVKFPKWHFYWICEMVASFFCDNIIIVNNYYCKYFKLFKSKVVTIYNGVDFSFFSKADND
jgi:glycosyltransferase involved in cell wall biosynthesis